MSAPRFLSDEDFREDIVRAVLAQDPAVDIVSIRESGLRRASDSQVLQFAWDESRIVVSHDANTMTAAAIERIAASVGMAGLVIVPQSAQRRTVAEQLVLISNASSADEWHNKVEFLPW